MMTMATRCKRKNFFMLQNIPLSSFLSINEQNKNNNYNEGSVVLLVHITHILSIYKIIFIRTGTGNFISFFFKKIPQLAQVQLFRHGYGSLCLQHEEQKRQVKLATFPADLEHFQLRQTLASNAMTHMHAYWQKLQSECLRCRKKKMKNKKIRSRSRSSRAQK